MKILMCAQVLDTDLVGPAVLTNGLLAINQTPSPHEVWVLSGDVKTERPFVLRLHTRYPRWAWSLDIFLRNISYYKAIKRLQKHTHFDVIVFSNAQYGVLSRFFLPKKIKIGGFINDYLTLTPSWQTYGGVKERLFRSAARVLERLAVHHLDLIFTCSDDLQHRLREGYRASKTVFKTLYRGIDTTIFPYKARSAPFGRPVKIVFIKAFFQYGGLEDLATALGLLREYVFEVAVLGPDKRHETTISNLFNQPHVSCHCIGPADKPTVRAHLYAADILCIPSRLEAMGVANVEGLATGIAVVSTREGGIPEVLGQGAHGWLADKAQPTQLAAALRACIETPVAERLQKSAAGRHFVETHFNQAITNQIFLRYCQEILEK